MKKVFLLTKLAVLFSLTANAQYVQTFETTSLATLVDDSGWQVSGVTIGNNNKLTGAKELQTQILNTSTSTSTYLVTYYYQGQGYNQIQFQHVINNASGKNIDLTVSALDSVGAVIGTPFSYTYASASARTDVWSFNWYGRYKLRFEWSGAKVTSGSSAFLDMVFVNAPFIPLPVKLIDFNSEATETGTAIKWISSEESNMNRYELYKSLDGIAYNKVFEHAAKGFGEFNEYLFIDKTLQGAAFYKIKMVDNDGSYSWSNVIAVNGAQSKLGELAYPIPAGNMITFENKSEEMYNATLNIKDASGRIIKSVSAGDVSNGTVLNMDISDLNSGVYFLQLSNADKSGKLIKFIKY